MNGRAAADLVFLHIPCHTALMSEPNAEEVERLVAGLMTGITSGGAFTGPDGISAVLTFTYRFSKTLIALTPKDEKKGNTDKITQALRLMAARIEFEGEAERKEVIH